MVFFFLLSFLLALAFSGGENLLANNESESEVVDLSTLFEGLVEDVDILVSSGEDLLLLLLLLLLLCELLLLLLPVLPSSSSLNTKSMVFFFLSFFLALAIFGGGNLLANSEFKAGVVDLADLLTLFVGLVEDMDILVSSGEDLLLLLLLLLIELLQLLLLSPESPSSSPSGRSGMDSRSGEWCLLELGEESPAGGIA